MFLLEQRGSLQTFFYIDEERGWAALFPFYTFIIYVAKCSEICYTKFIEALT